MTVQLARKDTRYRHMGYSFGLAARVILYAPSHRRDSTYHGMCYTIRGALAGTRNDVEMDALALRLPEEYLKSTGIQPALGCEPTTYIMQRAIEADNLECI